MVGDELFDIVCEAAHLGIRNVVKRASLARIATETLINVIERELSLAHSKGREAGIEEAAKVADIWSIAGGLAVAEEIRALKSTTHTKKGEETG